MCTVPVWGLERIAAVGDSPRSNGSAEVAVTHEPETLMMQGTVGDRTEPCTGQPSSAPSQQIGCDMEISLATNGLAANGEKSCTTRGPQDSQTKQREPFPGDVLRLSVDMEALWSVLRDSSDAETVALAHALHDAALKKRNPTTGAVYECFNSLSQRMAAAPVNKRKRTATYRDEVQKFMRCISDAPNRPMKHLMPYVCDMCQRSPIDVESCSSTGDEWSEDPADIYEDSFQGSFGDIELCE